ncbi:MAG: sigma-54-dependent Fis family transcriptional regulator [Phycisphaerae bacterium]|nr:sigma-54-dependent Fis family transcriptional regulator [Planctomycetota bacterium]MBL7221228.1 sigma-54-dependent Fis family transcriptional regulator [Phycisphaerae bacterium]
MLLRVILAINDNVTRKRIRQILRNTDVSVDVLKGRKDVWARALTKGGDVLLIDQDAVEDAIQRGVEIDPSLLTMPAVVAISDYQPPAKQAELIASGCEGTLHADLPEQTLREALLAILEKRQAFVDASVLRRPMATPQLSDFVSESPTMQAFMDTVLRVVQSSTSLLILGETGTGKERLARAIHAESPRAEGPFVAVNCGALPESLLESELFGHEEGAFTGATRARRGSFELAHGGTIFLDEIGDMPLHLQVKLLRVLQEYEVQRVGGEQPFAVDVRIMAASNRDLARQVEEKQFRQDLYYRLSVVTLEVPPLRERKEDIPALAGSYIGFHQMRIGCEVYDIDAKAVEALVQYAWPGNVRELINVIERAMLLCRTDTITLADLPVGIQGFVPPQGGGISIPRDPAQVPSAWLARPLRELRDSMLADLERVYLAAMLCETNGKIDRTAERAGIDPRSLFDKMKQYGLAKEDFRPKKSKGD